MKNFLELLKRNRFLILLISLLIFSRLFIFMPVVVEGTSMFPTLKDGETGVSFLVGSNNLSRGDIVVINKGDRYIVKRVVGLPGEHICVKAGTLYINNIEQPEDYLADGVYTSDFDSTLSDDEVFCMGDNRQSSADSRSHGPFKINQIVAKGFFSFSNALGLHHLWKN